MLKACGRTDDGTEETRGLSGSCLEHPHSGGDQVWGFIGTPTKLPSLKYLLYLGSYFSETGVVVKSGTRHSPKRG